MLDILPTPKEMVAHLDTYVHGQSRAKQDLAVAVYNHYLSQAHLNEKGEDLGRHHILIMGPTGVGKTYMVKTLAKLLGVPLAFTSATSITETGYKGQDVDSIMITLIQRAKGDPRLAEKGIVFIDEIDKVNEGGERKPENVQADLLTYLDGIPYNAGGVLDDDEEVDTGKILFICTGAFVGLDQIINDRLGKGTKPQIGFLSRPEENVTAYPDQPVYTSLAQAQTSDLIKFGMIPEFIGRFATVTVLHDLSQDDLRAILSEKTARSPFELQKSIAAIHGIELELTSGALDAIAKQALELGTGARGLHRLVGQALDCVDSQWSELAEDGVKKVIIDQGVIYDGDKPTLLRSGGSLPRMDKALRRVAMAPPSQKSKSGHYSNEKNPLF